MTPLAADQLAELDDGIFAAVFDTAIKRIGEDMNDRPGLDAGRDLNVKFSFKPVVDDRGFITSLDVRYVITESVPSRKSRKLGMGLQANGTPTFSARVPDDHRQQALPYDDEGPQGSETESESE